MITDVKHFDNLSKQGSGRLHGSQQSSSETKMEDGIAAKGKMLAALDAAISENQIRLDISRVTENQGITNMSIREIIGEAYDELKSSKTSELNRAKTEENEDIKLVKEKMKNCLVSLKRIQFTQENFTQENNLPSVQKVNDETEKAYEEANIFIDFVETLSLHPGKASNPHKNKEQIQYYFSPYYNREDMIVFNTIRNKLLRDQAKNWIKPVDIKNIIIKIGKDIKDFLNMLGKYVERMLQRVEESKDDRKNSQPEKKFDIEEFDLEFKRENMNLEQYVNKEFKKLIDAAYTEDNITEEVLFNYVVNFYPASKEMQFGNEEVFYLRNNLIHNFHQYGTIEYKQELYKMRHQLFNYMYAQEVIRALGAIETDEDLEVINEEFRTKLEYVQNEYIKVLEKTYTITTDEASDFAGYKLSEKLHRERDDDLLSLVDQYLKFMIILDYAEECNSQSSESRNDLKDLRRREIFEKFANNGIFVDEHESKRITDIVKSLKKIRDDHNLSNRFVVSLVDQRLKNEKLFCTAESRLFVKSESAQKSIVEKFESLPLDKPIKIKIGKEEPPINISCGKVINNMLNTFYNAYNKYTIEFDIEKIFNDETFIKYLVKNAHSSQQNKNESSKYKSIIKTLLENAEYTAPYIARLITDIPSLRKDVEKDDSLKLVKILLQKEKGLYIKHLKYDLLVRKNQPNLYGDVCNAIAEPDFETHSMQLILENLKHAEKILTALTKKIKSKYEPSYYDKMVELSRRVLEVLINSVFQYVPHDYEKGLKILDCALILIENIRSNSKRFGREELMKRNGNGDSIVISDCNIKLKKVKLIIHQGTDLEKNRYVAEANAKYDEALDTLSGIPGNVHPQSLSALSYEVQALYLRKQYSNAYDKGNDLYKEIAKKCGLDISGTDICTEEMYVKFKVSTEYKNLLDTSPEYEKQFNILKISEDMARARLSDGLEEHGRGRVNEKCQEALKIYTSVYRYKKSSLGEEHMSTLKDLRYIVAAHVKISDSMFSQLEYQDALENAIDACIWNCILFKIQKKKYGNYHPAVTKSMDFVMKSVDLIVSSSQKVRDAKL